MSADGERSPKRQRLESYSPASPQPTLETRHFVPPQTPPPSVRMSPSWTAQALPAPQTGSGTSTTFPTPPSTAGYLGQMAGRGAGGEAGGDSGHQTPAAEDEGYTRRDKDGDAKMTDRPEHESDGASSVDAEHRRTDHDREGAGGDTTAPLTAAGVLYKLSTAPIPPSRPHPSQDLIQLYDLKRIQAAVARKDPVTGEKINVLRKSYANKVKNLGLEGRNKAQSNLHELEGLLDPMWNNPVDGGTLWQNHCAETRMDKPDVQEALLSKLKDALRMEPGRMPAKEHEQWKSMLGLDEAIVPAAATKGGNTPNAAKPSGTSAFAKMSPGMGARNSAPASPRSLSRPDRSNKRRRYDDSSYEGYQQGYEDDGYSTGGVDDTGRRGSGAKRQKRKQDFASSANSPGLTNGPGNNGMVGVRIS